MSDTWLREETSIFIGWLWLNRDRRCWRRHMDSSQRGDGDRTAETNSSEDRGSWSLLDRGWQSWPDCRAIVARSPRDHGHDRLALMAHDHRAIVAINRPFTRSNGQQFLQKFPFKNRCILSLFLNSWLNREGIKQFLGKILSSSWSPAFRLDCDPIGAGLITKFHRILSNFPLKRRMSLRKKQCKFASIRVNWSPIFAKIGLAVRFDRLSDGNLSFD